MTPPCVIGLAWDCDSGVGYAHRSIQRRPRTLPLDTRCDMMHTGGVRTQELRRIALAAQCDPRTVARYLKGGQVKGMVGDRIKDVLDALGIVAPRSPLESSADAAQELTPGTEDALGENHDHQA